MSLAGIMSPLSSIGYGYTSSAQDNGNILSQTILPLNVTQNYSYDSVSRLTKAAEVDSGNNPIWSQTSTYGDQHGNRHVPDASGYTPSPLTPTASTFYNAGTNRLVGGNYGFDSQGNQTVVSPYDMSYDAEGQIISFTSSSDGSGTYTYDGEGRRVSKTIGSTTTIFVYDAAGTHIADYSNAPQTDLTCSPCFLGTGALGTPRVIAGPHGTISLHDYMPFREELFTTNRTPALKYGVLDNISQTFTGKERDAETGLDYFGARYFSGAQGRFTSPDPKMFPHDITDPQSWNKYGYTRNNPLRFTDPNGEDFWDYLVGAANAFGSDNALGAGRATSGNSDFKTGQAIGDAVATLTGTLEALGGGGEALVTSPAALTGVGIVVPAAGAAVAAHGVTTAAIAGGNLANAAFASINEQKQAGHEAGTPQNDNRINQGKPTSTFKDAKEGRDLTQDTHATGTTDPKFPNQKTKNYGRPVGTGANGGDQTRVRVHEDSRGKIHGHPDGPEQ